jgi:hypothetical protein
MALYASVAQFKDYQKQRAAGVTDAQIEDVLTRASAIVRGVLRKELGDPTFDLVAYGVASTKLVRGYDTAYLPLPPHQAGSVTLVEYQTGTNPPSYTTLEAVQWDEEDGRLYRPSGWGGYDAPRYRITAIWGYGATVPDEIAQVTLEITVNIWRSKDAGRFTNVVGVEGGGAVGYEGALTPGQKMILQNYAEELRQGAAI